MQVFYVQEKVTGAIPVGAYSKPLAAAFVGLDELLEVVVKRYKVPSIPADWRPGDLQLSMKPLATVSERIEEVRTELRVAGRTGIGPRAIGVQPFKVADVLVSDWDNVIHAVRKFTAVSAVLRCSELKGRKTNGQQPLSVLR